MQRREEIRKYRNETCLTRFVDGLKNDIKHFVLRCSPKTLDEAVSMALHEEQKLILLGKSARVNAVENSTQETNNDTISRALNEMLERMNITERNMAKLAEEIKGNASRNQHSRNMGDARHMAETYGNQMGE